VHCDGAWEMNGVGILAILTPPSQKTQNFAMQQDSNSSQPTIYSRIWGCAPGVVKAQSSSSLEVYSQVGFAGNSGTRRKRVHRERTWVD
jgi:hypothetical protein